MHTVTIATRVTIIALPILMLISCTEQNPITQVTSVTINHDDETLIVGATLDLTATVLPLEADTHLTWTSQQPSVATVASTDTTATITAIAPGTTTITATSTTDPTKHDSLTITVVPTDSTLWTRQFGTSYYDRGAGVATDGDGNVLVTGYTLRSLEGSNAGRYDAFVRKYDPDGNHLWTKQFGTSSDDFGESVATDGDGNVLVTGYTFGSLEGSNAGLGDVFVRKYAPNGDHLWTKQFGTSGGDSGLGVAIDGDGNVLIAGYTTGSVQGTNAGSGDVFVRKYDSNGNHLWTKQFGTSSDDFGKSVATDGDGNVLVTGYTTGSLEGSNAGSFDVFVRKYDPNGDHLWTKQFGTSSSDSGLGVATDGDGNVLVTGGTYGSLEGSNAGTRDAFVREYDSNGNYLWTKQFGTSSSDSGLGVATDGDGTVLIAGYTGGALEGGNAGGTDVLVRKYDSNGNHLWTKQFGTSSDDFSGGVATDGDGNAFVSGWTAGTLQGSSAGHVDAFVRGYRP